MSENIGPVNDRDNNKDKKSASRNLSNRTYGHEEGDKKPAAEGNDAENVADREGAVEKSAHKSGISYEPDKNVSGAQGAFGQGNDIKGVDGPQGYGASDSDQYKDTDYDGLHRDDREEEK